MNFHDYFLISAFLFVQLAIRSEQKKDLGFFGSLFTALVWPLFCIVVFSDPFEDRKKKRSEKSQ